MVTSNIAGAQFQTAGRPRPAKSPRMPIGGTGQRTKPLVINIGSLQRGMGKPSTAAESVLSGFRRIDPRLAGKRIGEGSTHSFPQLAPIRATGREDR